MTKEKIIANIFRVISISLILIFSLLISCGQKEEHLIEKPEHGFLSKRKASKWEESMLTGNGTIGALVPGNPKKENIILSHEKLFMPEFPPHEAPPLYKYLDEVKERSLRGKGGKAADLLIKAGKEVGINDMIWTDPLVPACQLQLESLSNGDVTDYARSVNYETGEASTVWKEGKNLYNKKVFFSRPDRVGVMRITGDKTGSLNFKFRFKQLYPDRETRTDDVMTEYQDEDKEINENEEEAPIDQLIKDIQSRVNSDHLFYSTTFQKQWENSLKGYVVEGKLNVSGGNTKVEDEWVVVNNANQIEILIDIKLSYSLPLKPVDNLQNVEGMSYSDLLKKHKKVHAEMFNRFDIEIGTGEDKFSTPEELLASSSYGNLNPELVNQLCEASRYTLISSTGEIPPTLQGIWGGTWRPAWSSDYTLNGNVPSVLACGLNANLPELTESYINYMWSMLEDFKYNAKGLYKAPGIFVPSRTSSSGKTYHYGWEFPHLFWYTGNAWTSHFFYDYWQYTGDKKFLRDKAIPFMLASAKFYESILEKNDNGQYNIVPSYSPEVHPKGNHPLAVNATMDVASIKQLMRNLLELSREGWIESKKSKIWEDIIENLPEYAIDESGDLKEWIWPELENNNQHRHASHLYPLYDEVDPEFKERPELKEAAKTAIENRLEFRREQDGGDMAFGLVQLGLAAAHINDTQHAYECVDWLCNTYWSPSLTSYHNPGEIFNVDICGGLPAVVTEMILQSNSNKIELLPTLPDQWDEGEINGARTRCGVIVDLEWKNYKPVAAKIKALRNTDFKIKYKDREWKQEMKKGQTINWRMN